MFFDSWEGLLRFIPSGLRNQRVTETEVQAAAREQGIGGLEEVGAVVLETDGSLIVIKKSSGDLPPGSLANIRLPSAAEPPGDARAG